MPTILGITASQISGRLTPAWSPEGGYDALATTTVGATAVSSITFSGIPSGYKHLQLRGTIWTSGATNPTWQVNGDSQSGYRGKHLWGTGTSATSNAQSGTVYWNYNPSASYPSAFIMDWFDYSSSTKNKTMRTFAGSNTNGGTSEVALWSGLYINTSPITSITLSGNSVNFVEHTDITLYGVK